MPERDYGLGGREAREAYDSSKAYAESQAAAGRDDPPPTRPRARPESKDTSESPTISIVDADTDETVANWDVNSGDVTFSGDSSLSETTQRRKKSKSGLAVPEPKINIGPLEIKERDAKLDVSMDWSNVFDNLLKDAMPRGVDLNRFKTSWDGETIKILDVGMSFAEGGKVSDKAQLEMELIMNEQVDPVSGNTAPIGAKPEEVRDDVEIRVSPGEYVVNAQTVRYFGEGFFDELQKAAAEGFERIKEGEELPFRDDELDIEDDETEEVEPEGFAYGGRVKGYAEGDLVVPEPVGGGYGQYGGTGAMFMGYQSKTFINDETGQKIIIFFFNGRPLSRIPAGFREMGETPAEEQEQAAAQEAVESKGTYEDRSDEWRSKDPTKYSMSDFKNYGDYYSKKEDPLSMSQLEKGILTLAGDSLLGRILGSGGGATLIKKTQEGIYNKANKVNEAVNNILEKGEDNQGNKLTKTDNNILFRAQYNANLIDSNYRQQNPSSFTETKTVTGTDITGKDFSFTDDFVDPGQTKGTAIFDQPFYQTPSGDLNVEALMPPTEDDKPSSAFDFNPSTSVFSSEYERSEALSGNLGNQASYLASQEIHSQGLQAKGLEDTSIYGSGGGDSGSGGGDSGDGDKKDDNCVIATHGISTGGFSRLDKAKAELWCERTYHGKWYGEAFRRGYRYAGNKAIEKGKASEHYQEFKDFVSYGRGLKKGLKPAINYYLRTTQFFLTGLFVK